MKKIILIAIFAYSVAWADTNPSDARIGVAHAEPIMEAPGSAVETLQKSKLEIVLSAVIAILGILAKINWTKARNNDQANEIFIKAIELVGNPEVKKAVAAIAASEGQTAFISKKVDEKTSDLPPNDPPLIPPAEIK